MSENNEDDDEEEAEIGMREGMTLDDARAEIMTYASKLEPREIRLLKSFYPKELHGFITQAARQKSKAQKEYEKGHEEVDTLQTILETKEQHGQLQIKVNELTENLNALRSKFDETSDMLKSLIVEHETLKSSSEKDKETIDSLNSQIAELSGKIEDLEKSVEAKDEALTTKDKELLDKDKELQDKCSQITGHDAEKDRLASQLDELTEQVAKKDEIIGTAEGELTTLHDEIATLQTALKEKEIRLQSMDYEYFKDARKRKAEEVDKLSE
ncbi:MAG TPA: hypothetical protein VKM55_21425 [Candidatus Lokiarchaeia archaeon]|nr:hypothetical protein [Candidatus Lokiarchaeia archaeon]